MDPIRAFRRWGSVVMVVTWDRVGGGDYGWCPEPGLRGVLPFRDDSWKDGWLNQPVPVTIS